MTVSLCFYSINCMVVVHCCHRELVMVVVVVVVGYLPLRDWGRLGPMPTMMQTETIEQSKEERRRREQGIVKKNARTSPTKKPEAEGMK